MKWPWRRGSDSVPSSEEEKSELRDILDYASRVMDDPTLRVSNPGNQLRFQAMPCCPRHDHTYVTVADSILLSVNARLRLEAHDRPSEVALAATDAITDHEYEQVSKALREIKAAFDHVMTQYHAYLDIEGLGR